MVTPTEGASIASPCAVLFDINREGAAGGGGGRK
jgi:hypothetical protein